MLCNFLSPACQNSSMTKYREASKKCDCVSRKWDNANLKDKECCLKRPKYKYNLLSSGKCSKGWEQNLLKINLHYFRVNHDIPNFSGFMQLWVKKNGISSGRLPGIVRVLLFDREMSILSTLWTAAAFSLCLTLCPPITCKKNQRWGLSNISFLLFSYWGIPIPTETSNLGCSVW